MASPLAIDNTLLLVQVDWVISLGKFESASWEIQLTHEAGLFPPGTAVRSGGGFWGGERDSIVVGWGWLCVCVCLCGCGCVDGVVGRGACCKFATQHFLVSARGTRTSTSFCQPQFRNPTPAYSGSLTAGMGARWPPRQWQVPDVAHS